MTSVALPWSRRFARKTRRLWRGVVREQSSPERLGAAVALGVFWGCAPVWGLQSVAAVTTARLLKLNRLVALGSSQISAPPMTPVIIYGSLQIGHRLVNGTWLPFALEGMSDLPVKDILVRFTVAYALGAVVVGGVLASVSGLLATRLIRRARALQARAVRLTPEELDALVDRLDPLPTKYRHYGAWKARLDPIYAMALPSLEGRAEVLDLGGGMGLLPALLTARSPDTRVRSVEWDAEKVQVACRLLAGTRATVDEGDAFAVPLGEPDAICLFDILHHTDRRKQEELLARCADALAEGGVLLVRERTPEAGQGTWAERIERWAVARGWNHGGGVHRWPPSEIKRFLEARGFEVSTQSAGRTPFSANALLTATRMHPAG